MYDTLDSPNALTQDEDRLRGRSARPEEEPMTTPGSPPAQADSARDRAAALRWCTIAYGVALVVAIVTALSVDVDSLEWRTLIADVAATVAIFVFSVVFRNSSFYDPYWSVAPIVIVIAWLGLGVGTADPARAILATAGVSIWGVRLTYNWWRGWRGIDHEDWRYVDLQNKTGALYWPVSFLGIHMMPTLMVFLGCLPLAPALVTGSRPFGWIDALGTLVLGTAIWWEAESDNQLLRFRRSRPPAGSTLSDGLWSLSRHPNYFGEILFWWGIFLLGLGAAPEQWWRVVGASAITIMFRVVSLPMIDTRMCERRPDYAATIASTPSVVPRLLRRR
jgi:steroid 5-alpha reductase family enzyme